MSLLSVDKRPQQSEAKEVKVWSDGERERLLDASERLDGRKGSRHQYRPILFLAARTGMRLGELCGLQWGDFDKDEGAICVKRQWVKAGAYTPPKTASAVRRIPLSPEMVSFLIALRLRSRFSQNKHPIFASATKHPMSHHNVTRRGFEPAAQAAGTRVFRSTLRATRLLPADSCWSEPVTAANVLGHADTTVTLKVYAGLFDRDKAYERVRPGDGQWAEADLPIGLERRNERLRKGALSLC